MMEFIETINVRLAKCVSWMLAIMVVHCQSWSTAATPFLIGRSSCASATCHGGIIGSGPAWHTSDSVWEAYDPHTRAGRRLFSDQSRRIVARLAPETHNDPRAYFEILRTRCVSCHATVAADQTRTAGSLAREDIERGVSCESCHGPASEWVQSHTEMTWHGPSRFEQATGMRDTESWLSRTATCARCHVGSRSADGLVRDVNHDLIAAGHPVLRFDMVVYFRNLPPHWDPESSQGALTAMQQHTAARLKLLQAAADLTRERWQAQSHDPLAAWPELADYDCFGCHQALSTDRRGEPSGRPAWNPWYTARLNVPKHPLALLRAVARVLPEGHRSGAAGPAATLEPESALDAVARDASARAESTLARMQPDSAQALANTLHGGSTIDNWYDAAIWYLEMKAAVRDAAIADQQRAAVEAELAALIDTQLQFDHPDARFDSPAHFQAQEIHGHRHELMRLLQLDPTR
jgi:hypothetical protein